MAFAHGFAGNIEIEREIPLMRAFHDRATRFCRFIVFDRRGTGLSDRPPRAHARSRPLQPDRERHVGSGLPVGADTASELRDGELSRGG